MATPDQVGSPFRAAGSMPVDRRFGGRINANNELSIHALGDSYTVEGNGTVTSLPSLAIGEMVFLRITGAPTFINSAKLLCPSGVNYVAVAGDFVIARSLGDGVWQLYVVPNSQVVQTANNLSDVVAATARTNLGLASAALRADTDFPRTDATQSLTATQKSQAQSNLYLAPTKQVFLSGSGTYTTPANVKWIEVVLKGGGGGGGGSGTGGAAGNTGGNTNFGTITASGGGGGANAYAGGSSGAASGASLENLPGSVGGTADLSASSARGGAGGGDGAGAAGSSGVSPGTASTNSGAGGGGGFQPSSGPGAGGGGSGGFCRDVLSSPSATYAYAVGAGAGGGAVGTGGQGGGGGAAGRIVVIEHYGT